MATFTNYTDYTARMIAELPMVSPQVILQEMQKAGVQFFKASGVWTQFLSVMNIVANQAAYTLTVPAMSQLFQIEQVVLNYTPTVNPFDTIPPTDPMNYYLSDDQTQLIFHTTSIPSTSVTGGMQIRVMLIPTWDATGVPSCFINRYAEGIMARTKYNLFSMARKPWSDPHGAQRALIDYNKEMSEAARDKYCGNINQSSVMAIPSL